MAKSKISVNRIALCGLLTALMLVLGYIESMLPAVPGVPGIKLGLSNGVLIFAIYLLDIPTAFALMVLKVVLSGLLFSGVSAMMYAFAGGVLSLIAMSILSHIKGMYKVTVSMVGGAMHNVGQVLMAMLVLNTPRLVYYMAILLFIGLGTGLLIGICATYAIKHLKASKIRFN